MRLPQLSLIPVLSVLTVTMLTVDVRFSRGLSGEGKGGDGGFIRQSQGWAQTPQRWAAQADQLLQQGIQQFETSQFEAALQSWQQALGIYQRINDRQGEGSAAGNLGIAYHVLGDYGQAIEYHRRSLVIARETNDQIGEGQALGNLGLAYYALANYPKAIEYQQQSLAVKRKTNDRKGEGQSLGNIGTIYYAIEDYRQAIEYHQRSLAIAQELKDRLWEGQSLGNLGLAYDALGNYTQAIEYHQRSLAISRELKDRFAEGKSLTNLGLVYCTLGDYTKAIDYHQQGLAIKREIKDLNGEGLSLNNLGLAFFKAGDFTAAEKTLFDGIKTWELIRQQVGNDANKVSIFEEQARTYRILQQVLVAQNKTDTALEISERGRARAFVELLQQRLSANSSQGVTLTPPTIAQLKQIAQSHNATVVEYSITYDDFLIANKEETRESELYIWVIKPSGEVGFKKVDLKPLWQDQNTSLENLVYSSRDSIGVRGRGLAAVNRVESVPPTQPLQQLYQLLIEPIADLLPNNPSDRVIFIPQQSLFLVPFPALQNASDQYLIQNHTILTAPSIQVLQLTQQQKERLTTPGQNTLIVGNPTMPKIAFNPGESPQPLPNLPGAEQEAKDIAQLFNTRPLIGNQATKINVVEQMKNARIIHLATHGLLDDLKGLEIPGAIALAPSQNDNGLLTAEDIFNLQLKAELVVLSACDTGRGTITGDGVIGLSRSLISAGVPSVLVSLWSVPDAPTASLMIEFYQNWQKYPDKAQALRQAMLTTLQQHPNPRDWAAFTLIGEAE